MRSFIPLLAAATALLTGAGAAELQAMVYRGPATCAKCPSSVANLLESSPHKFKVTYAGPNEAVKVTAASLRDMDVFAYGGGPGAYF
jgi:hypothetical protein